ncbi:MAG: glutamate--tRNA ligase [Christensenellales bacterium]|jgi:glutamyl-tRNA synthetase
MKVRTRFAPSPTGYLHIGGLRTALYGYLFAKKHGGDFILRIEDTDQERYVEGATEVIYKTLQLTGLYYDEGPDIGGEYGPYVQTQRRDIYQRHAHELVERGGAYYCFCTKERLDALRGEYERRGETFRYDKHCRAIPREQAAARRAAGEPYVIRQDMPTTGETVFDDVVYGRIVVENDTLDDTVLMKSDGLPTYNFANVVDDHLMEISHVIRGSEYLSSTPKYNLLYQAFGWELPVYLHLPPVMKDHGKKLSKRDGDASFEDFLEKGYLKEAIVNYIALLGWNPGTNQEKFTLSELCEAFDIKGISKSPAIFDENKLAWLNGEYIRAMAPEEFDAIAQPYYDCCWQRGRFDTEVLSRSLQPRVDVLSQIPEKVGFLAQLPDYDIGLFVHKKMKTDPEKALGALRAAQPVLQELADWDEASLQDAMTKLAAALGIKNGQLLWPLRIALAGQEVTPGGAYEIAVTLGREESLRRLGVGLGKLEAAAK